MANPLGELIRELQDEVKPKVLARLRDGDDIDLGRSNLTANEGGLVIFDNGAGYVPSSAIDPNAGASHTYVQDSQPSGAEEGETWYDTGANASYVYDGANWVEFTVVDHSQLSGLTTDNHHVRPTAGTGLTEDANDNFNVNDTSFTVSEASHSLGTGEYVALARLTIPSGTDMEIHTESISNDSFNAPSGLNLVVRSATDATNEYTSSTVYNEGSPITTVTTVAGEDVIIAADNGNFTAGSGASQIITASMKIRLV